ncbi:formin-J [Orussus abietinus]|uniref:formin-J n=1 Tax=Orussus abietinus TaxID=222816 RepID=UPI000625CC6B|nr:formin-J [Orussus abietinus]XP_012288701.1 formin-J [Orussus abietinus]
MSDLIDLSSPDSKNSGILKLASPLIPTPTVSTNDEGSVSSNLETVGKLNSLENNPFDKVFHETAEYISKKNDPFEIVLEKVLKSKEECVNSKAHFMKFKDDFTPKRTRHSDILKMNKTLDDSLIELVPNSSSSRKYGFTLSENESLVHDLNNTSLLSENYQKSELSNFLLREGFKPPNIMICPPSPIDLSILNNSAMNDSLMESSRNTSEEDQIKYLIAQRVSIIEKGTNKSEYLAKTNDFKKHKLWRSLSHGDKLSPKAKIPFKQRTQSIVESLKVGKPDSESSLSNPSILSDDPFNTAFLMRQMSNSSVGTGLSSISSISRLNSDSSWFKSSLSVFSDGTMNQAFLRDDSKDGNNTRSETSRLNSASLVFNKSPVLHSGSANQLFQNNSQGNEMLNAKSPYSLSVKSTSSLGLNVPSKQPIAIFDLAEKFQKLRMQSETPSTTTSLDGASTTGTVKTSIIENQCTDRSKLIDIDDFITPAVSTSLHQNCKNSSSTSSTPDSVFFENSSIDKSILFQAKALAKTFEQLAEKTVSGSCSSGDDLVSSQPQWNFDLLPVSDDEQVVDNLIELPPSPNAASNPSANTELQIVKESSLQNLNDLKKDKNTIKELEMEFIDPLSTEKKAVAATLLLDLQKLIKTEHNSKAKKLLDNLEKALGINYVSNVELLTTCLQNTNDLTKSSRTSDGQVDSVDDMKNDSADNSREENLNIISLESTKEFEQQESTNLSDNLNTDKEINKTNKSLIFVNEGLADISPIENTHSERSVEMISDDSINIEKKRGRSTADEKMAMELLVSLGKVLNGQNVDSSTMSLLQNLGKVLNFATSQSNSEYEQIDDRCPPKIAKVTPSMNTFNKQQVNSSEQQPRLPKSASRRSLDSTMHTSKRNVDLSANPKSVPEKTLRRSISISQTTTSANKIANSPIAKDKHMPQLKEVKKRFSSDPGFGVTTDAKTRAELSIINKKTPLMKDNRSKSITIPELQTSKSSRVVNVVKNKLKKKTNPEILGKKGPLRALVPLGSMQRRGSLGKKVGPTMSPSTPPKSTHDAPSVFTVTSSTPNPTVNISGPMKSPKNKPVASSTPDAANKIRRVKVQISQASAKRNISCNISPVTSKISASNGDSSGGSKRSSKIYRLNKTLSPPNEKTSTVRPADSTESSIPKYSPFSSTRKKNSFSDIKKLHRRSEPFKFAIPKDCNKLEKSPTPRNNKEVEELQSPLKNNNKLVTKMKPSTLISKLRRCSSGANIIGKENRP